MNQLQWRKEDQEDRQTFHPPSLLSRKLRDAKKEARINRKKFHLPVIHPSRNLVGKVEAVVEDAAEYVEVVVEVQSPLVG